MPDSEKEISLAELAAADGADGRPAYLAYQGKVFDVSASQLWAGGEHMASHQAGRDLTGEFADAPHGLEVFERYPQVGVLAAPAPEPPVQPRQAACPRVPWFLAWLLGRVPLLRRHPHPMVVHFPIVFMFSATFFPLLSLATGLLTWWLNYDCRVLRPVTWKIILSPLLLLVAAVSFYWRWRDPAVLDALAGVRYLYLLLILSLAPLAGVIGWLGARLTFPLHQE